MSTEKQLAELLRQQEQLIKHTWERRSKVPEVRDSIGKSGMDLHLEQLELSRQIAELRRLQEIEMSVFNQLTSNTPMAHGSNRSNGAYKSASEAFMSSQTEGSLTLLVGVLLLLVPVIGWILGPIMIAKSFFCSATNR